ncbi:MAG: DUF3473 domain-containing protein [Brasilonema sp.]
MDENCLTYGIEISNSDWEETKRQCQKTGGENGAAHKAIGKRASGFSCRVSWAYFSITSKSLWALEILADLEFRYDSSIFPVQNWRYGIPNYNSQPQQINTSGGLIYEIPASVRRVFNYNIPVSGGAYFRLYPYKLTYSNFRALEQEGRHVIFYIHPWELDLNHPPLPLTWKEHITHYINRFSTELKLKQLLQYFSFAPLGDVLENEIYRT